MISKNVAYGVLEIDIEKGRLWLNCPSCILRIQNIEFKQPQEKFSMIDINGTEAYMYPGDMINKEFGNFLEEITTKIVLKTSTMSQEKQKKFFEMLKGKIISDFDSLIEKEI